MKKLYIKPTNTTPEIILSPEDSTFSICGISSPEDVRELYYPVIEWVNNFTTELIESRKKVYTENMPLVFRAQLNYFNSSSAKFLYDIFIELKKLTAAGIPVVIEWHHDEEDLDLRDAGFDIALLAGMEFTFIPKKQLNQNEGATGTL